MSTYDQRILTELYVDIYWEDMCNSGNFAAPICAGQTSLFLVSLMSRAIWLFRNRSQIFIFLIRADLCLFCSTMHSSSQRHGIVTVRCSMSVWHASGCPYCVSFSNTRPHSSKRKRFRWNVAVTLDHSYLFVISLPAYLCWWRFTTYINSHRANMILCDSPRAQWNNFAKVSQRKKKQNKNAILSS